MSAHTCLSSTHGGEFVKRQESICAKRAEIAGVILRKADEATAWTKGRDPPSSITFDLGPGVAAEGRITEAAFSYPAAPARRQCVAWRKAGVCGRRTPE